MGSENVLMRSRTVFHGYQDNSESTVLNINISLKYFLSPSMKLLRIRPIKAGMRWEL